MSIEPTPPLPDRKQQILLYLDDTGSRHLDRLAKTANEHPTWYGLGGVLVREEDEPACKSLYDQFVGEWPQIDGKPLHLTDMRSARKAFSWLEQLEEGDFDRFWREYDQLLTALPVIGVACVVHRPGYLARGYGSRVGDAKWNLCRTAFNIVVERSAKFAIRENRRMRVRYEGADKLTDQAFRGYFALLKNKNGLGFNPEKAAKYDPMDPTELAGALIDLERKDKRSRLMQIADTYVYAIARGRYKPAFPMWESLMSSNKIIDQHIGPDASIALGVKYSCFDGL